MCVSLLGAWAQEWIDTLAKIDINRRELLPHLLAFEAEILAGVEYLRPLMIDSSGCLAVEQSALVDRNKLLLRYHHFGRSRWLDGSSIWIGKFERKKCRFPGLRSLALPTRLGGRLE